MERKSSFIDGFFKAANLAIKANNLANKAIMAGVAGGALYGTGKALSKMEDPEQKQLRIARKANLLPYQKRVEV